MRRWLEDFVSDVSYGIRSFRRNPTFAMTALGCLALGIGANTLIFSLVHSILLRQLPYPAADRVWRRIFRGDPEIVGKRLCLDLTPATVVGVMPPGYQTLDPSVDLWRLQTDENLANALRSPNRVFNLFARLKPGITMKDAQAE